MATSFYRTAARAGLLLLLVLTLMGLTTTLMGLTTRVWARNQCLPRQSACGNITCCNTADKSSFYCCPIGAGAVCCPDTLTCCPKGSKCQPDGACKSSWG